MTAPVTSQAVEGKKIAMTAPVTRTETEEGLYETSFIMPREWTMETLPIPNNKQVSLKEVAASQKAVWTFGGYANSREVEQERVLFKEELTKEHIIWTGAPTLAQYNDPRTPAWMRRNELWVDLN